jgi:hypothetical protein
MKQSCSGDVLLYKDSIHYVPINLILQYNNIFENTTL